MRRLFLPSRSLLSVRLELAWVSHSFNKLKKTLGASLCAQMNLPKKAVSTFWLVRVLDSGLAPSGLYLKQFRFHYRLFTCNNFACSQRFHSGFGFLSCDRLCVRHSKVIKCRGVIAIHGRNSFLWQIRFLNAGFFFKVLTWLWLNEKYWHSIFFFLTQEMAPNFATFFQMKESFDL